MSTRSSESSRSLASLSLAATLLQHQNIIRATGRAADRQQTGSYRIKIALLQRRQGQSLCCGVYSHTILRTHHIVEYDGDGRGGQQ